MGPKLFSFTKGETTYSLRLFPIGGYCAMEGEDEDSENPRAFNNAKVWKRLIIIIAGAVMNILLGLVLMIVTLLPQEAFPSTTVGDFSLSSYSEISGMKDGDKIVKLNNYGVMSSMDMSFALSTMKTKEVKGNTLQLYKEDVSKELYNHCLELVDKKTTQKTVDQYNKLLFEAKPKILNLTSKDKANKLLKEYYIKIDNVTGIKSKTYPVVDESEKREKFRSDVTVERNGEKILLKDVDFSGYKNSDGESRIVQDFLVEPIEKNFFTLIGESVKNTVSTVKVVWSSLIGLITGQFSIKQLTGPVGLASVITEVAGKSLETSFGSAVMSIVYIMMVITVNLGVVNMLPFPALDGGRFLFLLIEAVFKKPIPRKVESAINTVGLILLLSFTVLIAFKDIFQIFNGGFDVF